MKANATTPDAFLKLGMSIFGAVTALSSTIVPTTVVRQERSAVAGGLGATASKSAASFAALGAYALVAVGVMVILGSLKGKLELRFVLAETHPANSAPSQLLE